ncbi:hypothetical protein AMS68_006700 [Peltaster fructicola]|uniref:protein O-GlcNAc transferase n=1 Tax=Peltaster fructicola TaxID=286661 RepID=A0A6H0Y2D5_9PEZI|nr:hypothetical protein AMS68_006700 [Peltaster fructicola]
MSSAAIGGTAHRPASHTSPIKNKQYALPIHPSNASGGSLHESAEQTTPRAEDSLRRKTPSGTIFAGYDATDTASNPYKHKLLPIEQQQSYAARYPFQARSAAKHTFVEHQRRQEGRWSSTNPPAWLLSSQGSMPVMDSVLNQVPSYQVPQQPIYHNSVPSVIQPSFPFIGPTAAGGHGTGPYGPYYYDGTFVPYRPAAVRDPRFYHFHPPGWHGVQHHYQPHPYSWAANSPLAPGWVSSSHTAYNPRQPIHGNWSRPNVHAEPFNNPPQPLEYASVSQTYGPDSPPGQQRDRLHSWALQQYRDLLAFIHQSRRQQQHARQIAGEPQMIHRPSFYPKPPGQGPTFSPPKWHKRRTVSSGDVLKVVNPHDGDTNSKEQDQAKAQEPVWSPNGLHMHDNEYQRRASHEEYRKLQLDPSKADTTKLRRSSASISPIIPAVPYDNSPPSRALLALSHVTKACQEENWQWVDGLHLGGCLAYGLGNYHKALRWYNKVLEIEPGHLEVMSNLAATLLAVGQKEEAEQYWTKVVKAAPNHFEAVEHLVGLLCSQNRSKDAVAIIEHVERTLRQTSRQDLLTVHDQQSESSSVSERSPKSEPSDKIIHEYDHEHESHKLHDTPEPGFGSSGFAVPAADNGRMLALIHAKGNMMYALGDNSGAAKAFEDAVLIAAGRGFQDIQRLIDHILSVVSSTIQAHRPDLKISQTFKKEPILLTPEQALQTARFCFPAMGELPGLQHVPGGNQSLARRAVLSTTSNSLLSLAKIYQDGMSNPSRASGIKSVACGVRDILALYYLSLSLQPSPSTANNVGILLASVQQVTPLVQSHPKLDVPGVVPGSGIALALQYYNYGLQLDKNHAHLYTNLGSLLKDIGQLDAAIAMYELAVKCDAKFDIALANLANAVKDKGRISDAITYYKRAVDVNPNFAEAVCGLANALNSVCNWHGRGGLAVDGGRRDRWHVDDNGMLLDAKQPGATSAGWISRVVDTVKDNSKTAKAGARGADNSVALFDWAGRSWEGARVARLVERTIRRIAWQWYRDLYVQKRLRPATVYKRPQLPPALATPSAPTVLPFHTFTCPMSAKQIRLISQRNGLRITVCSLRSPWLANIVFTPPKPPEPYLRVGYISSDFNNHPLAHLMQSVFGLHNRKRVMAYCYATTPSDHSIHRQQIQNEAPVFRDASQWSAERLVKQIVEDGIHILVNLNGYTRGARNEIFAARPAPIQMSFMGFAGTLGAEWCDYLLADETAIPSGTLRPWRKNVDIEDVVADENHGSDNDEWVYGENIIYCRDTFFCCDHKQSNANARDKQLTWEDEQKQRWQMRQELFPQLTESTIIFGNFNQLYKIDPTTFRTWLRILARVPNSILWLLRFPDLGEQHLLATARQWAGPDVAARVIFTDVAPKHLHISRARVCDLVLDTAECNAHTTAADVLWSGTPLLTLPRYDFKMCSRIAASILKGALPKNADGKQAANELIATSEEDYEDKAVALARGFRYQVGSSGQATGRLMDLRKTLYNARWTSALFDTARWVRDLEDAYGEAWRRYVAGQGGDIWLDQVPVGE